MNLFFVFSQGRRGKLLYLLSIFGIRHDNLSFDTYYLGFGFAILKNKKYFCKDDEKRI